MEKGISGVAWMKAEIRELTLRLSLRLVEFAGASIVDVARARFRNRSSLLVCSSRPTMASSSLYSVRAYLPSRVPSNARKVRSLASSETSSMYRSTLVAIAVPSDHVELRDLLRCAVSFWSPIPSVEPAEICGREVLLLDAIAPQVFRVTGPGRT